MNLLFDFYSIQLNQDFILANFILIKNAIQ